MTGVLEVFHIHHGVGQGVDLLLRQRLDRELLELADESLAAILSTLTGNGKAG